MGTYFAENKQITWICALSVAIALSPLTSTALTVQEVPNPRQVYGGWVTDMAGILSEPTEKQLNQMITQLEAKNGSEIAVVTVPEVSPAASPKAFTTELFNHWRIGKKGKDNGVLFLVSVKDHRVEIETGYGVEGILPDAKVGDIIRTEVTPRFKQKDFDGGTLAGTKDLVMILNGTELSINKKNISFNLDENLYLLIVIWGLPASIFLLSRSGDSSFGIDGNSGSGSDGGSSSGGESGGGGSSGGGGAGGDW